jgi:hypothetical protein
MACVPVVVHSYVGLRIDDCPASDSMAPVSEKMKEHFGAFEAEEGSFEDPSTNIVYRWAIVRSFDAVKLYHHPEGGLVRGGPEPDRRQSGRPVHRVYYPDGLASYVLTYRGRPVDNPYTAHLAAFPFQLIAGTRPMTLLFIHARGSLAEIEPRSDAWLRTALERNSACTGSHPPQTKETL